MTAVPALRPLLIDEQDGPCDLCASWAANKMGVDPDTGATYRRCDGCGGRIPVLPQMQGLGYASVTPHHYHLRGLGPSRIPGRAGVFTELCPTCYAAHRHQVYPDEPVRDFGHGASGERP
jgi:hypothetical protein